MNCTVLRSFTLFGRRQPSGSSGVFFVRVSAIQMWLHVLHYLGHRGPGGSKHAYITIVLPDWSIPPPLFLHIKLTRHLHFSFFFCMPPSGKFSKTTLPRNDSKKLRWQSSDYDWSVLIKAHCSKQTGVRSRRGASSLTLVQHGDATMCSVWVSHPARSVPILVLCCWFFLMATMHNASAP